ncbi:tryptophan synthase subunit alpha [Faecalicatena orotica]|uniref:Tryptophan synthase alpha chain n=1 Tax=Faecalicatena orotica TaxID=1544 RepID=A0A2Y9B6X1_9FIRM|nr:tryptophan synthase subunit alpha [Faecalicatena orotica]PWJ31762.1 tryptophan synthase alpha chain [Faecalicatena orotica]SSA53584.1 tryptophan synthase, alpha chain [Faecalicatena orotica]
MSKIKNAFAGGKAFIAFLTAGDPSAEKTADYILAMEEAGADLIEIGIPFSDPTAEGPVIQEANIRALSRGMTTDGVFGIVEEVRRKSQIPLVFLTYLNPVFHYGYEAFFEKCEELGVDGIIIPDLPYEEKGDLAEIAKTHGVDVISMIAPTSRQRIQMIAKEAKGFLYIVSSMGVTGVRNNIETDIPAIVSSIREVTDIPAAVGFGISTPDQAETMAAASDGAIVGSAIVKLIEKHKDHAEEALREYVKTMKAAVKSAE